jgi:hypothetical protein
MAAGTTRTSRASIPLSRASVPVDARSGRTSERARRTPCARFSHICSITRVRVRVGRSMEGRAERTSGASACLLASARRGRDPSNPMTRRSGREPHRLPTRGARSSGPAHPLDGTTAHSADRPVHVPGIAIRAEERSIGTGLHHVDEKFVADAETAGRPVPGGAIRVEVGGGMFVRDGRIEIGGIDVILSCVDTACFVDAVLEGRVVCLYAH